MSDYRFHRTPLPVARLSPVISAEPPAHAAHGVYARSALTHLAEAGVNLPLLIAEYLVRRHHSAVGLVDRAVAEGLVKRTSDPTSKSVVRVTLTRKGAAKLDALAEAHLEELAHLAPTMRVLWRALEHADGDTPHAAARRTVRTTSAR